MTKIKQNVMTRVHTIKALRPFASDLSAGIVLFVIALYQIGREVWVAQVWANMPSIFDVAAVSKFIYAAFVNTEFIVQALVVLALVAALFVIRRALLTIGESLTIRTTN